MSVDRDEKGRIKPGSVLNPHGNTKAKIWSKLREKIGADIDELYTEAKDLIKSTTSDSVKANLILTLLGMIKPKTEIEDEGGEIISMKTYHEALSTIVVQASKIEELEKKLEDYKKVDDIAQVPIGTNLRYFTKKDDELVFRMGGNLKSNNGLPKFVILKNALGVEWSVQVEGTIFYKKMTIQEIKDEYEEIIKELNGKIKKLKERIKELER